MLAAGRYLLGVAELALIVGFGWLGAGAARRRLVPALAGIPAHLATTVIALALLLWVAELLGTVGAFQPFLYLVGVVIAGGGLWRLMGGRWGGPSGLLGFSPGSLAAGGERESGEKQDAAAPEGHPKSRHPKRREGSGL
jgi:hypothetical protein